MNKLEQIVDFWQKRKNYYYDIKEDMLLKNKPAEYVMFHSLYDNICLFLTHLEEIDE